MPFKDHYEGFERESKFFTVFSQARGDCPVLMVRTVKRIIAHFDPEFRAGLFESRPCVRKLRYVGMDEAPESHVHSFFVVGEIYESTEFNGGTYVIKGRDGRMGAAYFDVVKDFQPVGIESVVNNAFVAATGKRIEGTNDGQLHRHRSRVWVEALADQFRKSYEGNSGVRVFSRYNFDRKEFGMDELLYDVLVCSVATTPSERRGTELFYVEDALWQVKSNFDKNARETLFDFNKLVIGSAENKLFIGPQVSDPEVFLDVLWAPAQHCRGNVYVALVPHPSEWDKGQADVPVWQFLDNEWVSLGRQ